MVTAKRICICNILLRKYGFSCKARPLGIKRKQIFDCYPFHTRTNPFHTRTNPFHTRTNLIAARAFGVVQIADLYEGDLSSYLSSYKYVRTYKSSICTCARTCKAKGFIRNNNFFLGIKEASLKMRNNTLKNGTYKSTYKSFYLSSCLHVMPTTSNKSTICTRANAFKSSWLHVMPCFATQNIASAFKSSSCYVLLRKTTPSLLLRSIKSTYKYNSTSCKKRGTCTCARTGTGTCSRRLSGEIFKEKETDILQTSLEQIAFSLESHKITGSQLYKSTFWKKLRDDPNRRLPYFTKTKSCLASCFSNVTRKFSTPYLQSNWRRDFRSTYNSSCVQTLLPYSKKVRHTFCSPKLSPFSRHDLTFIMHVRAANQSKSKSQNTCTSCLKTRRGARREVRRKVKNFSSPKNQNTTFSFTIKIGDYLSSGDQIGEKSIPVLRTPTSCTYALQRKSLVNVRAHQRKQHDVRTSLLTSTAHAVRSPSLLLRSMDSARGTSRATLALPVARDVPLAESMLRRSNEGERTARAVCREVSKEVLDALTVRYARKPIVLSSSGRVLAVSKSICLIQKTQPVLFYNSASLHVKKGEWVSQGSPILTLTHQTLITGDIVQGIPRIEQLFEAFTSPPPAFKDKRVATKFKDVHDTLHSQVRDIFRKYWLKNVLPIAVRKSLEEIGYILVEMIQKVYLSQGVLIADKHIEIIIRQIASKGQILDSGSTGLFLEEILPIQQIENANLTTAGKKCLYVPAVMGLTAASLNSDSFISAASFQETTRVLSRDAVVGKSDFLRGLKEKVVIGDLISAGTGLDIYFIYNTMSIGESEGK